MAGNRKVPEPIMLPTTRAVADQKPSGRRELVMGYSNGKGRAAAQAAPGGTGVGVVAVLNGWLRSGGIMTVCRPGCDPGCG
ncbi:hypothetical protein D3C81_1340430 [compost metagenome]